MVQTIPTDLLRIALREFTTAPWVWCWELTAERTTVATSVFRVCNYHEPITLEGATYEPFPVKLGELEQTQEGDLVTVDLSVSNVTRELAYRLEIGRGFTGLPVVGRLCHVDTLVAGPALELRFEVGGAAVNREAVTFTLETPNFFRELAPRDAFTRDRCRHRYKGRLCGYTGDLPTCDFTLADCKAHGDQAASFGLSRRWPANFGAFPGISTALR